MHVTGGASRAPVIVDHIAAMSVVVKAGTIQASTRVIESLTASTRLTLLRRVQTTRSESTTISIEGSEESIRRNMNDTTMTATKAPNIGKSIIIAGTVDF